MSEQVTVRFVTKDEYEKYRIGDSPLAIPRKLGRYGLSEVINHLLGLENSPQPFDFSINDQLIREPLSSFIPSHNLSVEDVLTIEYMPAYSLGDERNTVQADAWIGSLSVCDASQLLIAGCYDGTLQVSNCTLAGQKQMNESKVMAHEDPIRDVASSQGTENGSSGTVIVATASKDQSAKLWRVKSSNAKEGKGTKRDLSGAERGANNQYIEQMAELQGHTSSVEALAHHSDVGANKSILFTGDWAGNIFAWDVSENNAAMGNNAGAGGIPKLANMNVNRAHNQAIQGIQVSNVSGSWRMFSCAMDHSLKEWDLERQDCLSTFTSDSKIFTSMHYHDSSRIIGSSHNDGRIRLWDLRKGNAENTCLKITNGPSTQWVSSFRWHPSSSMASIFATTDYAGVVRLWDIRATTTPLDTVTSHDGKALCATWNPTAERDGVHSLYTGGSDCNINKFAFGIM